MKEQFGRLRTCWCILGSLIHLHWIEGMGVNYVGVDPREYEKKFDDIMYSTINIDDTNLNDFYKHYVNYFFAPVLHHTLENPDYPSLNFHLQSRPTNPVDEKHPNLLDKIMAMRVNFDSAQARNISIDPLFLLHEKEAHLRIANPTQPMEVNKNVLLEMLTKVFSLPRNEESHSNNRHAVGSYLYGKFGRMGLLTNMQQFTVTRPSLGYGPNQSPESMIKSPPGGNVIGVLPGSLFGTSQDRPLIVGAHWDTVVNTPGFDDNGSGVAVMMEVASTLSRAKCHTNKYTIIFVAFDLEESGCYGSLEFIRKYIMPEFLDNGIPIQGAYILDTLLNFDDDPDSQLVPKNWMNIVPEVAKSIEDNGKKGDFVAVISRNKPNEVRLAETFNSYFKRLSPGHYDSKHFNLKQMPTEKLASHQDFFNHTFFWRSDHARFWYYEDDRSFRSLGGVLITDTAFHRGYMHKCYHQGCDTVNNPDLNPQTIHFGAKITQALALAVAELSGGIDECDLSHLKLKPVDYVPISMNDIVDHPMPMLSSKPTPSTPKTTRFPATETTTTTTNTSPITTTRTLPTTQTTTIKPTTSTTTIPTSTLPPKTTARIAPTPQASPNYQQQQQQQEQETPSTFRWISLIQSILASNQPKLPRTADLDPIDIEPKAYQPNYGNQYNIDKLTFNMNAPAYVHPPSEQHDLVDYDGNEEPLDPAPLFVKTEDNRPLALVVPPSKPRGSYPETDILSYLARFLQGDRRTFRRRKNRKSAALKTSPMFIKLAM